MSNRQNKTPKAVSRMNLAKQATKPKIQKKSQTGRALAPISGALSSVPSAYGKVTRTAGPRTRYLPNGDIIVAHREYVADIKATTGSPSTFQSTSYSLNPGQPSTFPWLSSIAGRFESYLFEDLCLLFETEAPSSLGGSVILSIDYDASDVAPLTKQVAMSYRNAVRSAPWEPCKHVSLREDLQKNKSYYVRPAGLPANTDIKTYDVGNLFVCTQNVTTASAVCGELYVEYVVRLITPITEPNSTQSGSIFASSGMTGSIQYGTAYTIAGGLVMTPSTTNLTVTGFIIGQEYSFAQVVNGTGLGSGVPSYTGATGITGYSIANTATTFVITFATFTANASTITFGSMVTASTITANDVTIALMGGSPGF